MALYVGSPGAAVSVGFHRGCGGGQEPATTPKTASQEAKGWPRWCDPTCTEHRHRAGKKPETWPKSDFVCPHALYLQDSMRPEPEQNQKAWIAFGLAKSLNQRLSRKSSWIKRVFTFAEPATVSTNRRAGQQTVHCVTVILILLLNRFLFLIFPYITH